MSKNIKYKQKLSTLDLAAEVVALRPKLIGKRLNEVNQACERIRHRQKELSVQNRKRRGKGGAAHRNRHAFQHSAAGLREEDDPVGADDEAAEEPEV